MDFREEVMSHETIWGYMYGYPVFTIRTKEEQIIEIKTKDIQWAVDSETASKEFCWVWGWPGPDYNIYLRKDYGWTWAYTKEELLK